MSEKPIHGEFLHEALHSRFPGYEIVQAFRRANSEWLRCCEIKALVNDEAESDAAKIGASVIYSWLWDHTKTGATAADAMRGRLTSGATPPFELVTHQYREDKNADQNLVRKWKLQDRNIPADLDDLVEDRGKCPRDSNPSHANVSHGGDSTFLDDHPDDISNLATHTQKD